MAVRHGYGKIAGTDALTFAYDTGDTRNSYKGEPTVNYCGGASALQSNIDCSHADVTTILPDGSTGTARRITITGNTYGGIIRASIVTSLTVPQGGVSYTISCWIRNSGTVPVAAGWEPEVGANDGYLRPNNESGFIGNYGSTSQPNTVSTTWTKVIYTYSYNSTQTTNIIPFIYFGHPVGGSGAGVGATVDFYQLQIEVKSHATPYAGNSGTRSSTQGLVDLTGNRTIELANVSFNSSAQPEFDGSNDLITFGAAANIVNKSYTIETVFNRYSANRVDGIIGDLQYHWFSFYVTSNNELYFFHRRNSPYTNVGAISATGVVGTGYYHAVGVFDITAGMRVYLNGNLVASNSNTTAFDLSGRGPQYIGQHRGGAPSSPAVMSGQIPVLKIYEGKALTADEVRNNYHHYKTRFSI